LAIQGALQIKMALWLWNARGDDTKNPWPSVQAAGLLSNRPRAQPIELDFDFQWVWQFFAEALVETIHFQILHQPF
jgi:hypothetical protein